MSNLNEKKMNGLKLVLLPLLLTVCAMGVLATGGCSQSGPSAQGQAKKTTFTCAMHPQIRRDKPGDCPICGMTLIPVENDAAITVTPAAPKAGSSAGKKIKYWANSMNPGQHSPKPMKDEMGMDYVPVYEEETPNIVPSGGEKTQSAEKKVKYWVNPMDPGQRSDNPKKAPDGMDYVPVYEEETASSGTGVPPEIQGLAPVHITPYKAQLIDVKFATARKSAITKAIYTIGRFAGGEGNFASLAGDFAAEKPLKSTGRYVVADVYAMDIPFVKVGQKVLVTALSGSGPEVKGWISYVYPYDQTQSRVTRVKVSLTQTAPPEIFANVTIEAATAPKLAVPPTAVLDTGVQKYVFVQTATGTFSPEIITIGFEGDDLWEVTSGLKEGDQVVDGALYLIDADSKLKAAFSDTK